MSTDDVPSMENLISGRVRRDQRLWGEVFAMWGLLVMGTTFLEVSVWRTAWLWPAMIVIGLIAQFGYVRMVERRSGGAYH